MMCIQKKIKEVTRWKTTDGEEHSTKHLAMTWQKRIDAAVAANELLHRDGKSVLECLREMGIERDLDPVLAKVTKDTRLVIEHWQCCESPGYSVTRFNTCGSVFVHGDVGGWCGPYGNDVSIDDLIRYAKDKRTVFQFQPKEANNE